MASRPIFSPRVPVFAARVTILVSIVHVSDNRASTASKEADMATAGLDFELGDDIESLRDAG